MIKIHVITIFRCDKISRLGCESKQVSLNKALFHPKPSLDAIVSIRLFGLHRRKEERAQEVNKEQNGTNKEQNWEKRSKVRPFWGVVFHENTSIKSKFRLKGAEFFEHPQFYSSIAPMLINPT